MELSIALPLGQIDTLDVIAQIGPCNMVQLSDALRIDASTATRAVEPLVQAGYVERRRSESDARTVIIQLTRAGRRIEHQLTEERLAHVERSLSTCGPEERIVLAGLLERMVKGSLDQRNGLAPDS